jgi:hypothetical protein
LESRRVILGLELPRRADPLLVEAQAAPPKTGNERIAEVFERMYLEGPKMESEN